MLVEKYFSVYELTALTTAMAITAATAICRRPARAVPAVQDASHAGGVLDPTT